MQAAITNRKVSEVSRAVARAVGITAAKRIWREQEGHASHSMRVKEGVVRSDWDATAVSSDVGQDGHASHWGVVGSDSVLVVGSGSIPALELSVEQEGHTSHTHEVEIEEGVMESVSACRVIIAGASSAIIMGEWMVI